ncbi:MAG: glycerate kinase [Bacilli bacterium]
MTAKCALLDEDTALVGLTEASGINLVSEPERNPSKLTNIGTGQILAKLVERGYKTIIVGVGGSATNDGGIGLLIPLGFKFLDKDGNDIEPNGAGIAKLAKIVPPAAKISTKFIVATDISTPLLGENGAALQFAEQKGATREEPEQLEANMKHLVDVAQRVLARACMTLRSRFGRRMRIRINDILDAKRVSGFDLFAKYADLESHIKSCNILIISEGKFDKTDAQGKGPYALAKLAAKYKKPVWIFCGSADVTDKDLADMKLSDVKIGQILPMAPNMVEAQNRAPKFLSHLARDFVAALK